MYHTAIICEEIAEKMRSPEKVQNILLDSISRGNYPSEAWKDWTLCDGMPGIAVFYGAMDWVFPGRQWDEVADNYVKLSLTSLNQKRNADCSLFSGLSGLGLALHFLSKGQKKYENIQSKLDDFLAEEVHRLYFQIGSRLLYSSTPMPPNFYNVAQGLSGIILYFLCRQDNQFLRKSSLDAIELLSKILREQ